ncbi:SANT/Myb_domain [Hexamita inflata]|uniref:SANT/Myb domain n=1 Tax=Hexamita inflata TaxID=28002 RepID=A0AA86PK52_9EUKA|nr:SANT/Myb domain [Hexamita inflata]CAI9939968.1 SANT/Myb domain [Hexamita inflata]
MPYTKRWSEQENSQFFHLLQLYQKDFQYIAQQMKKTYTQVRSHYYNLEIKSSRLTQKLEKSLGYGLDRMERLHLIVFDEIV